MEKHANHDQGQFDIPYPESFGPLDTTYINELAIIVGNGDQGKYTIQSFSITAWSDLQLDLWDKPPVVLDKVTLNAAYSSTTGFNFDFGAQLNINEHVLFTTVSYGTLPYGGISDGDGERNRNAQSSGWSITATYAGDIDLLAIVKRLTLLDIASEVSNMNIRNVDASKDKGITLSNLTLSIQKSKSGGAIYIAADTEWSVFQHIEFAATFYGTGSWGFSLTMELQDDLLSLIPVDFIKEFSDYVKVNDTLVAFYVGKVQPQEAGPTKPRQPPRPGSRSIGPASTVDLALAVSTKLQMTDKFGVIKEWIGAGELEIDGYISTKSVGLGAKIPKKIQLCRDEDTGKYDIEITGSIAVAAGPGFEIALNADMDINCPLVTKNLIMFRNTGFVLNANGALGFQGKIASTLTDIFGIDGLEASGLSVKALFSLAQSGVPEELSLTGRLSLQGAGGLNSE
jgi:hypothetical protein